MKINVIKEHHELGLGEHEVDEGLGKYLIGVGVAEALEHKEEIEEEPENDEPEDDEAEEYHETEGEEMGVTEAAPSKKRGRKAKNKS